jgi:hypothetical protein
VEIRRGLQAAVLAGVLVPVLLGLPASPATTPAQPPRPAPGYHHLGATTDSTWSGVLGRVTVRDPAVRAGTVDFVATRFMAKANTANGVKWLEAGWAKTGWAGGGKERVYTFDTNTNRWTFYDQYPIADGDQIWIHLETSEAGTTPMWSAWLWWGGSWHLLTQQRLPITEHATVEEYVEVYIDPLRGGSFNVPPIEVDNVQVKSDPTGTMRYWTQSVPTTPGSGADSYCLNWQTPYDTWSAGSC